MPNATTKISFSVVIALLLGWGAISLLLIQSSNELLQAQLLESGTVVNLPKGVKLKVQIDKNVYSVDDQILISIRNDSQQNVWTSLHADGCSDSWWQVEQLFDGDQWAPVRLQKTECDRALYGIQQLPEHAVRTASWNGLVPAPEFLEVEFI